MQPSKKRILRLPKVKYKTGYGRSSIYDMMAKGTFPKCRKLGPRAVGWDSQEIDEWIQKKLDGKN
jgi:prophage regulatory protein